MSLTANSRRAFGAIAVCAALVLPACSSSGGSGGSEEVTTGQIAAKLKTDSNVTSLKSQLGSQADKFDTVVNCIAKAMHKDVKQSELKAYVSGDKKIQDLSVPEGKIKTDITSCAKDALGGG